MNRIPQVQRPAAGDVRPGSPWPGRLDSLQYLALLALLTASTLNGLTFDWDVLGAEVTIHPDQAVVAFLLPLLACAWVLGRFRIELTRFDWVVVGFVFSNFVSSLLSSSRKASLQGAVLLGLYAVTYFVVRRLIARRPDWAAAVSNWVLGLGVAQAAYSLIALLLHSRGYVIAGVQAGHLTETSVAVEGTFWEANLLGAYLALIAVFFAVRYLWTPAGEGGPALLFGLFATSLVLPLTLTRAAGLAFVLGMVAVVLLGWRFRREIQGWGRRTAAVAVILGGVLVLSVTAMDDFVSALSRHPNFLVERWMPMPGTPAGAPASAESDLRQASRSSVEGRVEVWAQAMGGWWERPILGHGTLGGSAVVKEGWWYSSLVQALWDTGLVGFSALLWIYAAAILHPFRAWLRRRQSPTSANLLGFSVGNAVLFLTSQFSSFLFLGFPWVFLGLTMGAVDADSAASRAPSR